MPFSPPLQPAAPGLTQGVRAHLGWVAQHLTADDYRTECFLRGPLPRLAMATAILDSFDGTDPCWTWFSKAMRPVAMFGFSGDARPPGTMQAWSFSTPELAASGEGYAYTRAAQRTLADFIAAGRARRIEACAWPGHRTSYRWLQVVGFDLETVLESWGHGGQDFLLMTRIAPRGSG